MGVYRLHADIPCSVNILTHNSERTLERTLASVSRFVEIVIADGGSTDATLDIARRYDCKIIVQDPCHLDSEGRIVDFSAIRNQNAAASSQDWIFRIDSDDWATEELVEQISAVCGQDRAMRAYRVSAIYERGGQLIDCAAAYPMQFVRLFRTDNALHYGGVNENIRVVGDVGTLEGAFVIPVQPMTLVIRKWWRYLLLELRDLSTLESRDREIRVRQARSAIRWFATRWQSSRAECSGRRLPARHEAARVVYLMVRFACLWIACRFRSSGTRIRRLSALSRPSS